MPKGRCYHACAARNPAQIRALRSPGPASQQLRGSRRDERAPTRHRARTLARRPRGKGLEAVAPTNTGARRPSSRGSRLFVHEEALEGPPVQKAPRGADGDGRLRSEPSLTLPRIVQRTNRYAAPDDPLELSSRASGSTPRPLDDSPHAPAQSALPSPDTARD